MDGVRERLERDAAAQRALAWNIAALSRASKLPDGRTFIEGPRRTPMTGDEMAEIAKQLEAGLRAKFNAE